MAPVEGDESHTKARNGPEKLVDDDVFCRVEVRFVSSSIIHPSREKEVRTRRDPAHPREKGQANEKKAWYKCPQKCAGHDIEKKPIAADASRPIVVLCMEGIEEGATHEVLGPDHTRGLDQKRAAETREAKSSESGGENQEDLEHRAETGAVILIGDNDDIHDIGWGSPDVDHHVDEDMLLDVKGPWIQANFATAEKSGEGPGADGEDEGECFTERVCDEEDDGRGDIGCGIAEVEKGVE